MLTLDIAMTIEKVTGGIISMQSMVIVENSFTMDAAVIIIAFIAFIIVEKYVANV